MPALDTLLQMIKDNGKAFKVAFSLSGVGIEQLEMHAPQVLDKLQELNNTGCVEFLAEPYSHGLASLANELSFSEGYLSVRLRRLRNTLVRHQRYCVTHHLFIVTILV